MKAEVVLLSRFKKRVYDCDFGHNIKVLEVSITAFMSASVTFVCNIKEHDETWTARAILKPWLLHFLMIMEIYWQLSFYRKCLYIEGKGFIIHA